MSEKNSEDGLKKKKISHAPKSKIVCVHSRMHASTDVEYLQISVAPSPGQSLDSRKIAIKETIVERGLTTKFADVAGLSDAKQTLKEAIILPLQFPQLFTGDIC